MGPHWPKMVLKHQIINIYILYIAVGPHVNHTKKPAILLFPQNIEPPPPGSRMEAPLTHQKNTIGFTQSVRAHLYSVQ